MKLGLACERCLVGFGLGECPADDGGRIRDSHRVSVSPRDRGGESRPYGGSEAEREVEEGEGGW